MTTLSRQPLASLWQGKPQPVTQHYGPTSVPFEPNGFHTGVDVALPQGTPLVTPYAGVVTSVDQVSPTYPLGEHGFGNSPVLLLGNGDTLRLGHLSQVNVQPGQLVPAGTVLGASGQSGESTGPHVHVEVRRANGKPIDPRALFNY